MSQLNVDKLRNASGTGNGIDIQTSGNFAFDLNTLYVDSTNNRVGINTSSPTSTLDIQGTEGILLNSSPILEGIEIVSGSSNSNTNIDALTSNVWYYTSANTGNWTPNVRGNSSTTLSSVMSTGQAIVINLISTNGGSSGYTNSLQIDGSSQTINWQDGSAPSGRGGTSGFDIWSFNIIKTGASSYLVFGSQTYVD